MSWIEQKGESALWLTVAAGAFLVLQTGAWLVARGRWQKGRERGAACQPPPRFMGGLVDTVACFLADLLPVILTGLPVIAAAAWIMFVLLSVSMPLGVSYGPAGGAAGGLLVGGAGLVLGIAVFERIGERRREAKERERVIIAAELRMEGSARALSLTHPHRG